MPLSRPGPHFAGSLRVRLPARRKELPVSPALGRRPHIAPLLHAGRRTVHKKKDGGIGNGRTHESRLQLERRQDSALALLTALRSEKYDVVSLLTTVSGADGRSTMHAIPERVLRAQAASIRHSALHDNRGRKKTCLFGGSRRSPGDIFLRRHTYPRSVYGPTVSRWWNRFRTSPREARTFLASGLEAVITTTGGRAVGREYRPRLNCATVARLPRRNRPLRERRRPPYTLCYGGPLSSGEVRPRLRLGGPHWSQEGRQHGGWFAPTFPLDCRPHRLTARDREGPTRHTNNERYDNDGSQKCDEGGANGRIF